MRTVHLLILSIFSLSTICLGQLPTIEWWYNLSAPSFGSSATDDIDGDGNLEIVFGTYFNDEHIYALNAENGTLLWWFDTGGCNDASPVIADVDLDSALEVIVPSSSTCMVYCFNGATGAVEWSTSTGLPNCIDSPPAVADIDNDGRPEVILGTFYGHVFCLNGEDGSVCWHINLGTNSYIQSDPAILDCDDDGQLDVIVAQWSGDHRVYALRGNNGSTLWFSALPENSMYHGCSFADIDEDGRPEVVIGCYDGDLYVFNAENGSLLWEYQGVLYLGAPTSIADLNSDGHYEIVFVSSYTLKVISHTGNILWSHTTGGSIFRGAGIADINGDDDLDVVFGSDDGILRALRGDNGNVIWTCDLEAHYGRTFNMDNAPIIADFDNNDSLDVFIIGGYGSSSTPTQNHGRGYMLTAGSGNGPGWKMFRHDQNHSGCFANIVYNITLNLIPANPPIIIPATGGSFEYQISALNNGTFPIRMGIWCNVTLPSGSNFGPVWGPTLVTIAPGQTLERIRSQFVPANAPVGNYSYKAYIGNYPNFIDSAFIAFQKVGGEVAGCNMDDFFAVDCSDNISLSLLPNPCNPNAVFKIQVPQATHLKLTVYNLQGMQVVVIANGWFEAGEFEFSFMGDAFPTGVYFYKLQSDFGRKMGKLLLLK